MRADLLDVERVAVHQAALEGQQLRGAGVVGDRLGGQRGVAAHERQRGRALRGVLQRLGAGLVGGAFGERVLDDPEGRVGLAQLGAQLGDLGDGDAAVVDREDRLRTRRCWPAISAIAAAFCSRFMWLLSRS